MPVSNEDMIEEIVGLAHDRVVESVRFPLDDDDTFAVPFGSPIEKRLAIALVLYAHRESGDRVSIFEPGTTRLELQTDRHATAVFPISNQKLQDLCRQVGYHDVYTNHHLSLFPQCKVGRYTADFVVEQGAPGPIWRCVLECDGHDHHERTKQQARHDRSRDRYMQSIGVSVLRFTGSEIHADPWKCAAEVHDFFRQEFWRYADAYQASRESDPNRKPPKPVTKDDF